MTVRVSKAVSDLHVRCSLDVRTDMQRLRGGFAAADDCGAWATSAVELSNGNRMYRCEAHRGVASLTYGLTHETVLVEVRDG